MAVRIVVSGATGRMGSQLGRLVRDAADLELGGGIAPHAAGAESHYASVVTAADASALLARADVLVDFSAPAQLRSILAAHGDALAGKGIVVGTTGLDAETELALDEVAGSAAVIVAANFSVGVNLLLELARSAAGVLDADAFDVEIVEAHHRHKADAPSGTALALGRAVAEGRGVDLGQVRRDGRSGRDGERPSGEIGFHALRAGEIVGEHEVAFIGANERITLGHAATDRAVFAEGALRAARWIAGRAPGRYTMRDVLGLKG
ncbi:MAG TPA: 4-hydroxy-tetrahydrodipicolinate reductase [Longimicrobiales bacterium]|nr:4-hydroxy-tetrahydrodipicolinate reductase [Longimicrobiales bacterium]